MAKSPISAGTTLEVARRAKDTAERAAAFAICLADLSTLYRDYCQNDPSAFENLRVLAFEVRQLAEASHKGLVATCDRILACPELEP